MRPTIRGRRHLGFAAIGLAAALAASACTPRFDVHYLAHDDLAGRNNGTPGSTLAQNYIIGRLKAFADGLNANQPGTAAYKQAINGGTNIVAVIPGTDLANEYVIVGAHYDHLSSCRTFVATDTICNGATDNATGVAAVIDVARAIDELPEPPRRSVILALWDREEDGLLGSGHYVQNPLVPLAQTVAYVNLDIQGANVLPSLRNVSFAIASESGGDRLTSIVESAIGAGTLETKSLSSIFGQGRSDYVHFIGAQVPTVFFSDATGPCYHTAQDSAAVVDFEKLTAQIDIAVRVTTQLATTDDLPAFDGATPLATYEDAVVLDDVVERALADSARFSPTQQARVQEFHAILGTLVADGPANFGSDDISTLLSGAVDTVAILTTGPCDGFLNPPS